MKFFLIAIVTTIVSCNSRKDNIAARKEITDEISRSFHSSSGYPVKEVQLVKFEENRYMGFIVLSKDGSKVDVEVFVDKDDPKQFIWKTSGPNATMVKDTQRELDKLQHQIDEQNEKNP